MPLVFLAAQIIFAAVYTVSQVPGEAPFTSVQEAINAAGADGSGADDIVEILDLATYEEQITIDSSCNGLTIRSSNPKSLKKPVIRHKDTKNIQPTTCEEAKKEESITFDQNGAFRVMRARRITIDGIAVDGGGPYVFGENRIWAAEGGTPDCRWPLQHGNAAITLWIAGDVVIRNCDLSNAYFGIAVKDRNEGGIYANANPADIKPQLVVPMSGFGKTGNHLIENNRIHNNSFGIFFESTWDLGSVIRYNLIYENHHQTTAFASQVKNLTEEGSNQPGGAIAFKDHSLSPVAIYNNTFYKNYLIFVGGWRPALQCLVFNNIYSKPFSYWSSKPGGFDSWFELSPEFEYRMHNCVYAAQEKEPEQYSVQLMNGLQVAQPVQPGALINDPFPTTADIRWFETPFMSEDPDDPLFLTPDWENSNVQKYIVDKGWPDAGIYDIDGSIADLGAIPLIGQTPTTEILIKPIDPVMISGTTAKTRFSVYSIAGNITNPQIKYLRWVNVKFQPDAFGNGGDPIPASDIIAVTPQPVTLGSNSVNFTIPARGANELYGFFELIIEGISQETGQPVASSVGFLPYREIQYTFEVTVWNLTQTQQLKEVKAGQPVILKIVPKKIGESAPFANPINDVEVSLSSGYDLLSAPGTIFTLSSIHLESATNAIFTKVPESGTDEVSVTGVFVNQSQNISMVFRGSSDPIKILPGDPAKVKFQSPPSGTVGQVNPGAVVPVTAQIYDEYDNKVTQPADVTLSTSDPSKINVVGSVSATSDETGMVKFQVGVGPEGRQYDTVDITATLVINNEPDKAKMYVGKARDRLTIYYSDTLTPDPSVMIDECSGTRVPITIRAIVLTDQGKDSLVTGRNTAFAIDLVPGVVAYSSPSELDTVRLTQYALTSGQAVIWVKSTQRNVDDGYINVSAIGDYSLLPGTRGGITFRHCEATIARAAYFADNGYGRVNRLEIFYKEPLESKSIPDSMQLFWPTADEANTRWVKKGEHYSETPDPLDSTHISVIIQPEFDQEITYSAITQGLGIAHWKNPELETESREYPFAIYDSVGPLLMSANLIERNGPGADTLYITLSESVTSSLFAGQNSLLLIKHQGQTQVPLNVLSAVKIDNAIRLVVADAGANSPEGGDSLKILPGGTISDQFGNAAHPDNRPVPITVSAIPPEILSAYYEDVDANGIVDRVTISFNKAVDISVLGVALRWGLPANPTKGVLSGDLLSYADANVDSIVQVNVIGQFTFPEHTKNHTSGPMDATVTFTNFQGIEKNSTVADRAAPVLADSVLIAPGEKDQEGKSAPDTLIVYFSENVTAMVASNQPYKFWRNGTSYSLTLRQLTSGSWGNIYTYEILSVEGDMVPMIGDSVNMVPSIFQDQPGNLQAIETNLRVPLKIKPRYYPPKLSIGPNPFRPSANESIKITIKPDKENGEPTVVTTQLAIYDPLGNKVYENKVQNAPDSVVFSWSGANLKGRKVGAGVYLAIIKGEYKAADNDLFRKPINETKYIAVKK
jgi:hypothetical protein